MSGAVFFDLDGTLADTAPDIAQALNRLLAEEGLPPLPYPRIRAEVSRGSTALVALAFGGEPDDAVFQARRRRFLELYAQDLCNRTRLFPGMAGLLQRLEAWGLPWGVVTNKPAWLTDPLLERLGLADRAAVVVSGDSTPQRKPHPEPLLHALRSTGTRAQESLYVGDDPRDIQAGRAAGMTTLAALYGYVHPEQDPLRWGAHGTVRAPHEILQWVSPSMAAPQDPLRVG